MNNINTVRTKFTSHHTKHENCLQHSHDGANIDTLVCSFQQMSITRRTDKDAVTLCVGAAGRHSVHHLKQTQQHVTRQTGAGLSIRVSTRPNCTQQMTPRPQSLRAEVLWCQTFINYLNQLFMNCIIETQHHFWNAPIGVCSPKYRHQSLEWAILSHINSGRGYWISGPAA